MPRAFNSLSPRTKFAKRHYEAVALAIQEARRRANGSNDPIAVVVDELADVFASDNGMFKRERFKCACVPGANVRARSNGGAG
jgi:methyl coenzyme M reductase alpha subunit